MKICDYCGPIRDRRLDAMDDQVARDPRIGVWTVDMISSSGGTHRYDRHMHYIASHQYWAINYLQ